MEAWMNFENNRAFQIDSTKEIIMTFNPRGYLKIA
jgi:hypothetical protein